MKTQNKRYTETVDKAALAKIDVQHGINCNKVQHGEIGGYLHDANDDKPYYVDGLRYCGRCHDVMLTWSHKG